MKKSLLSLLGVFLCFTLSHAQTRPAAPTNDADLAGNHSVQSKLTDRGIRSERIEY